MDEELTSCQTKETAVAAAAVSPAQEAAQQCLSYKARTGMNIIGLGFNCADPEQILFALRSVQADANLRQQLKSHGIRLAAYANVLDMSPYESVGGYGSGGSSHMKEVDLVRKRPLDEIGYVQDFVESGGVTIIGGCCGSNPDDIARIRHFLAEDDANNQHSSSSQHC